LTKTVTQKNKPKTRRWRVLIYKVFVQTFFKKFVGVRGQSPRGFGRGRGQSPRGFVLLTALFKTAAFRIAFALGLGRGAAYGDGAFIAMAFVVIETAMGYIAADVLFLHGCSSSVDI
jgi:hypothetical protein